MKPAPTGSLKRENISKFVGASRPGGTACSYFFVPFQKEGSSMPQKATWKTQKYYHGPSGAHRRAVYKAMGYTTDDMKRPLIAIVNTWGEVCPGHYNLDHLTRTVRDGIWKTGGTPLEFTAISQCPTASLGEPSMRYDLPPGTSWPLTSKPSSSSRSSTGW